MTDPAQTLKRWRPVEEQSNQGTSTTTLTFEGEPPSTTLLVDVDPRMDTPRNLVTLYRAAQVNGLLDCMFEPSSILEGQSWYDRLPRIIAMDTEAFIDDEKMTFTWTNDTSWTEDELQEKLLALRGDIGGDISEWTTSEISEHAVAEYVVVRILVRTERETQVRRLRSDFGIGSEHAIRPAEAGIITTRDCALSIDSLKKLIAEGIFEYTYDDKDDSPETQWLDFMDNAHTIAAKLLLNEHEAVAESVRHAARTHLWRLLPDDRTVQLRKKPAESDGIRDVEVVILRNDP